MKAIVQEKYGPPLQVLSLRDVEKPVPGAGEVVVRVRAAAINPADWHLVRGLPYFARLVGGAMGFGMLKPKSGVPGFDVAGVVEETGPGVTGFRLGDEVYAYAPRAFAEYATVRTESLGLKPAKLSFEQAAAVPLAAATALQGLRRVGQLQAGQRVLIIGASGGVGSFAVQIARAMGAHVTGVCSTRNVEMVLGLGAEDVIDYTRRDYVDIGPRYDVILQLGGTRSASELSRVLADGGVVIPSSGESDERWMGPIARMVAGGFASKIGGFRLGMLDAEPTKEDLLFLKDLIESGKVTPVIDRTYTLSQVPEAIAYVEQAHSRGKVVITV